MHGTVSESGPRVREPRGKGGHCDVPQCNREARVRVLHCAREGQPLGPVVLTACPWMNATHEWQTCWWNIWKTHQLHACRQSLLQRGDFVGVGGFQPPSWRELVTERGPLESEDLELGITSGPQRAGWSTLTFDSLRKTEEAFRAESLSLDVRLQNGVAEAGMALSTYPLSRLTTFTLQVFQVVLPRRLHRPLPLRVRNCRCGLPILVSWT